MAISDVAIANLALQKLGSGHITSLSQDDPSARAVNACYEQIRDMELRKHPWNFARKRITLAPDATTPSFDFDYAFPLPSDCLRLLPPSRNGLDWRIEQHNGTTAILTNDGDSLEVNYIARITDPTQFDPCFIDMLAAKIAEQCCEKITQSNTKKADVRADYAQARIEARRMNAFENISDEMPEDPWLAARR